MDDRKKKIEKEIDLLSKRINAINNETRLSLMGLLYLNGRSKFTDLSDETEMVSNKLSYHLNILKESKFIEKNKDQYQITEEGIKFIEKIGLIENIREIKPEEKYEEIIEMHQEIPINYRETLSKILEEEKFIFIYGRKAQKNFFSHLAKSIPDQNDRYGAFDYYLSTADIKKENLEGKYKIEIAISEDIYKGLLKENVVDIEQEKQSNVKNIKKMVYATIGG